MLHPVCQDSEGPLPYQQAGEPSQPAVSGVEDDAGEDSGNEEASERSRARHLYTGEAQYQEALLRKRIGALMTLSPSWPPHTAISDCIKAPLSFLP